MSGNLPPGVTDADIDRAAPGYDEPPCRWRLDERGWEFCERCGARWAWQCEPEKRR